MYTRLSSANGILLGLTLFINTNRLFAQANADVVISQIYTFGGEAGSLWLNDYVEIYNRSESTVDISSWALQYSPTTNIGWKAVPLFRSLTSLQSGQYFLVRLGSYDFTIGSLITADASNIGINISKTDGELALTNTTTLLSGHMNGGIGPGIVDYVSYGKTTVSYEGTGAAITPTINQALFRRGNGLIDTGNNDTDFELMAANPRNSSNFQPVPEPFTTGIIALSVAGGVLLRNRFRRKTICQT